MTSVAPIVVDLGEAREVQISALLSGGGTLAKEVEEVLRLIRLNDVAQGVGNKLLIPIVAIYSKDIDSKDSGAVAPNEHWVKLSKWRQFRARRKVNSKSGS